MDLEFTDDQEELRRSVRDFLEAECPISLVREVVEAEEDRRAIDAGKEIPARHGRSQDAARGEGQAWPADKLWRAMRELDWLALSIPEEFGGLGMGVQESAILAEELGRHLAPVPLLPTVTQLVPVVRQLGSEGQQERFLRAVAQDGHTGALAVADSPTKFWASHMTSTAEPRGDDWVLRGSKSGVMASADVDEVAVVARAVTAAGESDDSAGGDGFGVFVVPGAQLRWKKIASLDASRPLFDVTFQDVAVPNDRVLGQPGASLAGIQRAIEEATVALALETVGACDSLFDLTRQHALDRKQFGVPIGSFQAIKHKLVDLFVTIARARALAYYAVAAVAEDDPHRAIAVSMAKAAADDCQQAVCQEAIQIFGGIGFTWEHDGHLYVKRVKSNGVLFGSASEHRLKVAAGLGILSRS